MTTSTSVLLVHLDQHHQISTTDIRSVENRTLKLFDPSHAANSQNEKKSLLARSITMWLTEDLLPFNVVNGEGFKKFLKRHKIVQRPDEIPSNVTIATSALNDIFLIVKNKVTTLISNAPKVVTFTADMWTAKYGCTPYITLTMRYLDEEFNLKQFNLSTEHLPRPHTAINIARCIEGNFKDFSVDDRIFIGVGDSGRNICATINFMDALKEFIKCIGHKIHLCLTADVIEDERWASAKQLFSLLKRIHGVLVYQLPKLKEIYLQQQAESFLNYLSDLELLSEELSVDEDVPFYPGDEETHEKIQEAYAEFSEGFETPTIFHKSNVTRWFSQKNMVESALKNYGNLN